MSESHKSEIDYDPRPEERIRLKCGECGKEILTRDMTLIAEGVRCSACMAKLNAHYEAYKNSQLGGTAATQQQPPKEQTAAPPVIEIDVDTTYCKRHPKIETGLKCGRCATPICPKCMVYTPVGIRCPDCAETPIRTVGVNDPPRRPSAVATGPRRMPWQNDTTPRYINTPRHYVLAAVGGIAAALLGALVWGFLLKNTFRGIPLVVSPREWFASSGTAGLNNLASFTSDSFQGSIHLFPEVIMGLLVGEAISRITNDRRGRGLQFIAIGSILLGIIATFVVLAARIYLNYTKDFPALGDLLGAGLSAFGSMFQGGNLVIPLFWVVPLVLVWIRLNK